MIYFSYRDLKFELGEMVYLLFQQGGGLYFEQPCELAYQED